MGRCIVRRTAVAWLTIAIALIVLPAHHSIATTARAVCDAGTGAADAVIDTIVKCRSEAP